MTLKTFVGATLVATAAAHGRMTVPSARNAVWKDGPTDAIKMAAIPDYNLDGLAAGGPGVTPKIGHGLCGDQADGPQDHMAGGKFGRSKTGYEPLIVASYKPGQTFDVQVVLTAHHDGFFEWRLCDPKADGQGPAPFQVTQACFDKHVLPLADATQGMRKSEWKYYGPKYANRAALWDEARSQSLSKWKVPTNTPWNINRYTIKLRMPMGVSCERCVVQWYYQTGNSDGAYPEEFWNCADVEVLAAPKLNITPAIILDGDSAANAADQGLQGLGKCGISGQPNGMKCFSKDVRVTDQWCDKLKCDLAFASMCGNFDVDAECAPLAPIARAGELPPTPVPAPSMWESSWASTNTPAATGGSPAPAPTTSGGGGGGGSAVMSNSGGANSGGGGSYNYNFWANDWNYNNAPSAGGGGGGGGGGGKTVTTTTSTTTSTYH